MSHVSVYSLGAALLGAALAAEALNSAQRTAREAEIRRRTEQLVLAELGRNFAEVVQRQTDAVGNLSAAVESQPRAVPGKTGTVEVVIKSDNTLTLDVAMRPGRPARS